MTSVLGWLPTKLRSDYTAQEPPLHRLHKELCQLGSSAEMLWSFSFAHGQSQKSAKGVLGDLGKDVTAEPF